jgi:allantoate deiminase
MSSGAGHDAQMLARLCPSAMIFVPSRGGVSHTPQEYTSPRELAIGVLALTALLYQLGYEEERR